MKTWLNNKACEQAAQRALEAADSIRAEDADKVLQLIRSSGNEAAEGKLVRDWLTNQYPVQAFGGPRSLWRCALCKGDIAYSTYITVHVCRIVPEWSHQAMDESKLLTPRAAGRSACKLCGQLVSKERPHECPHNVLRVWRIDWSALQQGQRVREGSTGGSEQQLKQLRDSYGHVVVMTHHETAQPPQTVEGEGDYGRCHLLIGNSSLGKAAGKGIFTVHDMAPITPLRPVFPPAYVLAAQFLCAAKEPLLNHPSLNQALIGYYVGQVVRTLPTDDPTLACVTIGDGRWKVIHNPITCGSVMFLLNQAHEPRDNVVPEPRLLYGIRTNAMLVSHYVPPGSELVWDYQAVSDDPTDPLCSTACLCGMLEGPHVTCGRTVLRYASRI